VFEINISVSDAYWVCGALGLRLGSRFGEDRFVLFGTFLQLDSELVERVGVFRQ